MNLARYSNTVAVHARDRLYEVLLTALESAAADFGCSFVEAAADQSDAAPSHHLLISHLARRLARALHRYLYPALTSERLEHQVNLDMADGSAVACVHALLQGLKAAGVSLRPGKQTRSLVAIAAAAQAAPSALTPSDAAKS